MKQWIKRILGSPDGPQINTDLNALDDYVVVNKNELDKILDELRNLRNRDVKADANELDMRVAELELENKKLKLDVEVLTTALRDATMNHRE